METTVLSRQNYHPRDSHIQFFEEEHKYIINSDPDVKYTSVTTWVHSHFEKFDADRIIASMMKGKAWKLGHKYWGLTAQQIKDQWSSNGSREGTDLHFEIECFYNNSHLEPNYTNKDLYEKYDKENLTSKPIEWQYFINFVKDTPDLKPYRTEWTVYNEDIHISGSIDMIYENPDGTLSIYDWKRSKNITRVNNFNKFALPPQICHLPDSNFWHYALQLNMYKFIIEQKYGKIVKNLFLVKLHPDNEEHNYELIPIPILSTEITDLLEI